MGMLASLLFLCFYPFSLRVWIALTAALSKTVFLRIFNAEGFQLFSLLYIVRIRTDPPQ